MFEYKVISTISEEGSLLKFRTHFTEGDKLEFEPFSFDSRGDSIFHVENYASLLDTFKIENSNQRISELRVYNYDHPDMADEESFLFINSQNELIAVYNWTMGPLLILTFEDESPEPMYDFITSKSTQSRIHKKRMEMLRSNSVISFSGDTLPTKQFPDSVFSVLNKNRLEAKALAEQYPDSVELAIWHGRRVAYMGRYLEAIEVFTEALNKWPTDHRLLRHRGHRYITTRQLDKAIADFERANTLAQNAPNAIEPDGIPNKENRPLGNDKFNIYYHQGLAYYLNGQFDKAVPVYKQCMVVSDNDDLMVATSYWLFMTYHRLGMTKEADELLARISEDMTIVENEAYLDLLLLFKEANTADYIPKHPTSQYGLGFHLMMKGNTDQGKVIWQEIVKHEAWDSFGYIAAEAELKK